jgi:hypothetical protein
MKIFKSIFDSLVYLKDNLGLRNISIKIERFDIDSEKIIVLYRIGRQKLIQKEMLNSFQKKNYEYLSYYDQHRLTKFSTMQNFLTHFSLKKELSTQLKNYIMEEAKNEQLF